MGVVFAIVRHLPNYRGETPQPLGQPSAAITLRFALRHDPVGMRSQEPPAAALETPATHPHIETQARLRSDFFQLQFREETLQ